MATDYMYDLKIDVSDDGKISLTQSGNDETDIVLLHRDQLILVAKLAGLPFAACDVSAIAADNWRLRRRLLKLDEMIGGFAQSECYRAEIIDRCGAGLEIIAQLDAIRTLSAEFVADLDLSIADKNDAGRDESGSAIPTPSCARESASADQGKCQTQLFGAA